VEFNRQPDQSNPAPKRSMDGVRRTGGPVAQPQPLPQAAPRRQAAPIRPVAQAPLPQQSPKAKPKAKSKGGRHVLRAIAQTFLALAVILAVAGAIVWLYLRYYQ